MVRARGHARRSLCVEGPARAAAALPFPGANSARASVSGGVDDGVVL